MTTIGERIKAARKAAKLTQAALAEKSGVAAISIHQYESGKREPRTEQLQLIAKALNMSVDDLISEETEIIPGRLKTCFVDNPDSNNYELHIEAASPEDLTLMLDQFKEQGFYRSLMLAAFDQLSSLEQQAVVQMVQKMAAKHTEERKEAAGDGVDQKADR